MGEGIRRILIVHNAYQHRGGEDSVVDAESALLRAQGHRVELFCRRNDELADLSPFTAARDTLWSSGTEQEIGALIVTFRPEVIHVHNTFPRISPSIYWAAARAGVAVVQTLHNFRLLCPQAMFLRNGKVCEDCLGVLPWRGVLHRCYRDSLAQTAVLVSMLGVHRAMNSYREKVTRYIALSEFSRRKFVEGGLPAEKICVKPNFVDAPRGHQDKRTGALFVGRLSPEKGTSVLLGALDRLPGSVVDVVGIGPDEASISAHSGVHYHGWMEQNIILERMHKASYLIFPSIWYEAFPRTIVEAFACGLPVIASRLGAMVEIIEDGRTGLLFEPNSAEQLAQKISWAEANPAAMHVMGENARREYEMKYTPEVNYRQLMKIYSDAVASVRAPVSSGA